MLSKDGKRKLQSLAKWFCLFVIKSKPLKAVEVSDIFICPVRLFNIISLNADVEIPDIEDIMKTAMMLTIQGGSSCSDSSKFTVSLNKSLRLIDKLFKVCGSNTQKDELKNQTPVDMFSENDQDIEFYFDFDDVEGIDLDDEQNRFKRVLRFKS